MATVTHYTRKNQVGSSNVIEYGKVFNVTGGGADTHELPLNADQGFWFIFRNTDADVKTLAAQTGETLGGGVTTVGADECVIVDKTSATNWEATIYAAVDV